MSSNLLANAEAWFSSLAPIRLTWQALKTISSGSHPGQLNPNLREQLRLGKFQISPSYFNVLPQLRIIVPRGRKTAGYRKLSI
jgi:hypothetical protein